LDDLYPRQAEQPAKGEDSKKSFVLRLSEVYHCFGEVRALDGISFEVQSGEILGIIGRSGAGKSTLIRCLNGLERPSAGAIYVERVEITQLDEVGLQKMRRRVGMVFQHFNLLAAKTARANVALPLEIAGWPRPRREQRVAELLDLVGLSDKGKFYPAQLSGGQKQRIGIARALAASPALLLCDEATSALDPETTRSILDLLGDINRQLGLTIVLITHEMSVIRSLAHRVLVMNQGRIVERGTITEIISRPREEVTRSLLQSVRPHLPKRLTAALHQIHQPGDLQLVRLELDEKGARSGLFSDLSERVKAKIFLLHGGVDDVQGHPLGTLFVGIAEEDAERRAVAARFLLDRAVRGEVLGYVAASS
jgi:D-methionine transport system ATP-binding protein